MEPELEQNPEELIVEEPGPPQKSGITELFGTILIVLGVLIFLALLSFQYQVAQGVVPQSETNLIGTVGHYTAQLLFYLFGKSCFLAGPYFFLLGALTIYRGGFTDPVSRLVALITLMIGSSLLGGLFFIDGNQLSGMAGGLISVYLGGLFVTLFGFYGALILSFGIFIAGLFLSIRIPIPVLLNVLNSSMHERLQNYSRIFTQNLYYPGKRATATGPVADNNTNETNRNESQQIIPPWFERVVTQDPLIKNAPSCAGDESRVPSENNLQGACGEMEKKAEVSVKPVESNREHNQDQAREIQGKAAGLHIHENKNFFTHANDLETRSNSQVKFDGYFSQNESRFHFRTPALNSATLDRHYFPPEPDQNDHFHRNQEKTQTQTPGKKNTLMGPVDLHISPKTNCDQVDELSSVEINSATAEPSQYEQCQDMHLEYDQPGNAVLVEDNTNTEDLDLVEAPGESNELNENFPDDNDIRIESMNPGSDEINEYMEHQESQIAENDNSEEYVEDQLIQQPDISSSVPEITLDTNNYFVPVDILNDTYTIPIDQVQLDIASTRTRLEQVFYDYKIQARVVHARRGPIITLYEIKLDPGVKVARIQGISDELKMNLEAQSIRIIAPIPGKATVGIEIPNHKREPVALKDMVKNLDRSVDGLSIVLGADLNGSKIFTDLTRLPHLLIAGATGSGKSVYMNSIIASLLYQYSPEDLRFIMIDPKMVELRLFEGIPHLIMPVITDVKIANKALGWVVAEMEKRYSILSKLKCRDIRSYNDRIKSRKFTDMSGVRAKMPYMIVLIDELADLMMVAAKDVEDSIIRLTQKARAVGIHVIMATQRPSVDVITALIKANCPARIAFQVSQKTDSRTILDMNGAESLLGKGDMLYRSPVSTGMTRLQAPLITESEIEKIVMETRRHGKPVYVDLALTDDARENYEEDDTDEQLFDEAWKIVIESGKTSTSYVQRRLRIGYNRAANLIEKMEERGYLGPASGNKPREILKRT